MYYQLSHYQIPETESCFTIHETGHGRYQEHIYLHATWGRQHSVIKYFSISSGTEMQNESYSEMLLFIVFQELSKSLKSAKGKLYALKCDIAKESDVQAAFKWVKDNLGGVDILINNAGVAKNSKLTSTHSGTNTNRSYVKNK